MITEVMDIAWSLGPPALQTRELLFGWRVLELAGDAPANRRTIPIRGMPDQTATFIPVLRRRFRASTGICVTEGRSMTVALWKVLQAPKEAHFYGWSDSHYLGALVRKHFGGLTSKPGS